MTKYLAGVLSVIAVGVLLIAYGLLSPRLTAADAYGPYSASRPMYAGERVSVLPDNDPYAPRQLAYPVSTVRPAPEYVSYEPARRSVAARPVSYQARPVRVVERAPRRDWKKTAMVIGGSSAAGAGIGAIFGGKKGALIGAAIGGGAGTLYEVRKR